MDRKPLDTAPLRGRTLNAGRVSEPAPDPKPRTSFKAVKQAGGAPDRERRRSSDTASSDEMARSFPSQRPKEGSTGSRKSRPEQTARPLTERRIRNIAEHYVGQRECSTQMLRDVLERRLFRALHGATSEEVMAARNAASPLIEAEITRLVGLGFIDDARFAQMKARSWLASGRGSRRILMDLQKKGIGPDLAQDALQEAAREVTGLRDRDDIDIAEVTKSAEWEAADAFARKKRIGAYRKTAIPEKGLERQKVWRREASAMARAGFDISLIYQVLDRDPAEGDEGI